MPWIILHANGEELTRHELVAPIVIGRAPDCDIAIKDIMLSRTHCRLEPEGNGWKLLDLGSRNGTRVGWDSIQVHSLRDGDHVRMGRTRMVYFAGEFVPPPAGRSVKPLADRIVRPADPHEALSGTVTDFVLLEDEAQAPDDGFPSPQPRANEPESYGSPEVEALINDLASSVWVRERDSEREFPSSSSVLAETADREAALAVAVAVPLATPPARIRMRALPRVYREIPARFSPRVSETDLSLQVDESALEAMEAPPYWVPIPAPRQRRWPQIAAALAAAALGTAIMFMSLWLLTMAP